MCFDSNIIFVTFNTVEYYYVERQISNFSLSRTQLKYFVTDNIQKYFALLIIYILQDPVLGYVMQKIKFQSNINFPKFPKMYPKKMLVIFRLYYYYGVK